MNRFTFASRIAAMLSIAAASLACCVARADEPPTQVAMPSPAQFDANFANYRFRDGESLDKLRLHYSTLGAPHRGADGQIDNAVLVLHWTAASGHAMQTPVFMQSLYAKGMPLDAGRYYLIFPDSIGCGQSSKPSDGLRARFPHYGYGDMVDLQHRLVTEILGIHRLHAILGVSMGAMNAWQWAEAYPDEVEGVMPVVSLPIRVSGRNAIWRHLATDMIEQDPAYQDGNYAAPYLAFTHAYQMLLMMIDGVPHLQATVADWAGAGDFLRKTSASIGNADPNDVLYILKSSADYDPQPGLSRIKARIFALNFGDDEFNPDVLGLLEQAMPRIAGGQYVVQPGSARSYGHLTMAHPDLWASHVATFMSELESSRH